MQTGYFSKWIQEQKKVVLKHNLATNKTCASCINRQRVKFTDQCKVKNKSLFTLSKTCDCHQEKETIQ